MLHFDVAEDGAGASTTDVTIALPDGTSLAATLYLPARCVEAPAPCLLEALPYRKDDLTSSYRPEYTRFRDEHGYAVCRVDLRGTGSSTGIILDEYHASEQADLVEVIAWLAAQPWCSGAVGMFGTSWSGFNALQLACERPPALKAIVATYATDDRWTDDVHYMGGALRLLDLVDYPLYMVASNALPPVPALATREVAEQWLCRVTETPPWLVTWLREQRDGAYWRHGSVRPGYERIACPTLLIAGWADGYRNNTFRVVEALHAAGTPVHLLAGPWSHQSPATAVPGPLVDHVRVMARWWDRWLRETPNGVDAEPPVSVFVRSYAPPVADASTWPGRWVAHDTATLGARTPLTLRATSARLAGGRSKGDIVESDGVRDVGVGAWNSCAAALPWGQPLDQREDEARSVCLDWALPAGLVVIGSPVLRLRVRPDSAVTNVSAKLSLAPPARPSLLVSRGLLNLAYRDGLDAPPRPCEPGEWIDVEVELEACAFETGGEPLRIALACADWPNTVAPPGTWSAIDLSATSLVLPVAPHSPYPSPDLPLPADVTAEPTPEAGDDPADTHHVTWTTGRDVLGGLVVADVDHGSSYGGRFGARCTERYLGHVQIEGSTGLQRATGTVRYEITWPGPVGPVVATSEARLDVAIDDTTFDLRVELDATLTGQADQRRRWHEVIARDLA